MIDYDKLRARVFPSVVQEYTHRDTMLYALGLNIGADPLDAHALRYVAAEPPIAEPMMAMTLGRLGPWMREPDVGIDYRRIMVGEISLRLHAVLPPKGQVRAEHRVIRITDKGEGRGALVTVLRELYDDITGLLLAEYEQVTYCRADGGFARDGRHDPSPEASARPQPWQEGAAPDFVIELQTAPNQALIFRLSGDMNPLHSDPEVAQRAGFEKPILHGLATMGMAGHALARESGRPLGAIRGRLSGPVFPGARLRLEGWHGVGESDFRIVDSSDRVILSNGLCKSN